MNFKDLKSAEDRECEVCHKKRYVLKCYCLILCDSCSKTIRKLLLSGVILKCSTGYNNCVINTSSPQCPKCLIKKSLKKGMNLLCLNVSERFYLYLDELCIKKYLRYPDDLIQRLLCGEFHAVRSEIVKLFESKKKLMTYFVDTIEPTCSNSTNNLEFNHPSTNSSTVQSVQSIVDSFYLNETSHTIEICFKPGRGPLPVRDPDAKKL